MSEFPFPVGTLISHKLYDGNIRYGVVYKFDDASPSPIAWVLWQLNRSAHAVSHHNQSYCEPILVRDIINPDPHRVIDVVALPAEVQQGGINEC